MSSPATGYARIAFVASPISEAQEARTRLTKRYGGVDPADAEVIVALGGDGHMLATLRRRFEDSKPVYGMNCGTIGFLMNDLNEASLPDRLDRAETVRIHPLRMRAETASGAVEEQRAINEVSLLRQTAQTARFRIVVDGKTRMHELACDGVLVSTAAGSTAYNLSAHGPILPIGSSLLALTPISAFRPRRWRGALLPHTAQVRFEVIEPGRRPASASADNLEVRDVLAVDIAEDPAALTLLYDEGFALEERVLREQFVV
jgi:NAD+ kinase